jgi:hypothetical protein
MAAEPAPICRAFIAEHLPLLKKQGADLALVLLDENAAKSQSLLKHGYRIAKRQARKAGCSPLTSLARILFFKLICKLSSAREDDQTPALAGNLHIVKVPTLNTAAATDAVRAASVDLVCLMGTRILTRETLAAMNCPAINIHSSDPRFMRGAPSVVWEVLARRESIALTIHQVTPDLDSGDILLQRELPIRFSGGLGATLERTFLDSIPVITRLFAETIVGLQNRRLTPQPFTPGPLRVTPRFMQTLAAEFRCRANTRKAKPVLQVR